MLKNDILSLISISFYVLFILGVNTFFVACPIKNENMIMACHWVNLIVICILAIQLILAIIKVIAQNCYLRLGIDLANGLLIIFTFLVPNVVIKMCSSDVMHCQSHLTPFVHIMSIVILITIVLDSILRKKTCNKL